MIQSSHVALMTATGSNKGPPILMHHPGILEALVNQHLDCPPPLASGICFYFREHTSELHSCDRTFEENRDETHSHDIDIGNSCDGHCGHGCGSASASAEASVRSGFDQTE